jgi:hypothetical protein
MPTSPKYSLKSEQWRCFYSNLDLGIEAGFLGETRLLISSPDKG